MSVRSLYLWSLVGSNGSVGESPASDSSSRSDNVASAECSRSGECDPLFADCEAFVFLDTSLGNMHSRPPFRHPTNNHAVRLFGTLTQQDKTYFHIVDGLHRTVSRVSTAIG